MTTGGRLYVGKRNFSASSRHASCLTVCMPEAVDLKPHAKRFFSCEKYASCRRKSRAGGGEWFAQDARAWNRRSAVIFNGTRCAGREQQCFGGSAANDADLADATFDGALGGFQFQDHASGNDVALYQAFDLFAGDGGEDSFPVEHAGNIGEVDQLIRTEVFGTSSGHVVRIDVVELIVRANAETWRDREESFAPERFDERRVQPREIAHETETALHFVVHHRLGDETLRIRGGNAYGRLAFRRDRGHKLLVQQTGENHYGHVACFAVGDAQTGDEFAFDSHALKRGGEQTAAAMHDKNFVTLLSESGHLSREGAHRGVVFE